MFREEDKLDLSLGFTSLVSNGDGARRDCSLWCSWYMSASLVSFNVWVECTISVVVCIRLWFVMHHRCVYLAYVSVTHSVTSEERVFYSKYISWNKILCRVLRNEKHCSGLAKQVTMYILIHFNFCVWAPNNPNAKATASNRMVTMCQTQIHEIQFYVDSVH